jgi:hypothetical protein
MDVVIVDVSTERERGDGIWSLFNKLKITAEMPRRRQIEQQIQKVREEGRSLAEEIDAAEIFRLGLRPSDRFLPLIERLISGFRDGAL